MARYRIGETPDPTQPQAPDSLEIASVIFGLLVGIGFVYAGLRARQYWLAIWGAGLAIGSVVYLGYIML
jgi:hypothetical protein